MAFFDRVTRIKPKLTRAIVTSGLTQAATYYWVKKNFSVYQELGIRSKKEGALRADLISFNMKKEVIITEVKSCWSDFHCDKKWIQYLDYSNKFYFCIAEQLWESEKGKTIGKLAKEVGAGVMILTRGGGITVVQSAKRRELDPAKLDWIITKAAWRGGYSRYNIKRIKKVVL